MTSVAGKPSSAYLMLGASSRSGGGVPKGLRSSSQPPTQPGTDQLSGPDSGMSLSRRSANSSRVALYGERPLALRAYSFFVLASQTRAYRSPPTPQDIGSIRPRAALAAMAASTALPPCFRTSRPTSAASGWLVATMPCVASVSERPRGGAGGAGAGAARRAVTGRTTRRVRRATVGSGGSSHLMARLPAGWNGETIVTDRESSRSTIDTQGAARQDNRTDWN